MRIVFTGGGTGGHLYPILAAAREIKRMAEEERILDIQLFYFGPERIASEALSAEDIIFSRISAGKMRRYFSLWNLTDFFKVALGIIQALWKMFLVMPDMVFAKGGYGSFPTLLAARIYRLPVMMHESDAIPGRVNQWAGKWAARSAISFASAAKYFPEERTALTGIPIRRQILGGNSEEAREAFGIFSSRPVVFIMGGSQGSRIINQTVVQILKELLGQYEIIHQVGENNFEDMRLETAPILENKASPAFAGRPREKAYYHLVSFLDENKMRSAYFLADLVVSRAGATSIFEIAARGKPSILIPLKNSAQDHQRANAYEYARHGAAVVIEEDNLTPSVLLHEIQTLIADSERLKRMGESARAFSRPDAAETIAREILTLGLH